LRQHRARRQHLEGAAKGKAFIVSISHPGSRCCIEKADAEAPAALGFDFSDGRAKFLGVPRRRLRGGYSDAKPDC
jgi:hypothetical protein